MGFALSWQAETPMPDGRCIIVCRTCSTDADMIALVPFASWRERGKWASEHTRGTGHRRWLCLDGWVSHEEVREILFPTSAVDRPDANDLALFGFAANATTWVADEAGGPARLHRHLVLDPRCISVTEGNGKPTRLDLRHFEPCRCGDWSTRLTVTPEGDQS